MKKGFSVAEATIALLIGSVALGMAAPMITKQIKYNNITDTQSRVINQKINNLTENNKEFKMEIEELIREEINNLRSEMESIPSGMVAFFYTQKCPKGWKTIDSKWNGRFPRFSGSYTILNWDSSTKKYKTTGTSQTLDVGTIQEDAIRNITGSTFGERAGYLNNNVTTGAFYLGTETNAAGIGSADSDNRKVHFNAQKVVPTDIENRPRAIALLGCVKE